METRILRGGRSEMSELVFLLEEPSAREMLTGLLPKILPAGVIPRFIVFDGKQDLEKQMVQRMRGYLFPGAQFVILRDQDAGDCKAVKAGLRSKCDEAGKPGALIRVACHELESWYLGDLAAVEKGLMLRGLARRQNEKMFRTPDSYPAPSQIIKQAVPSYQKVSGSRAIGPHLDPGNTRSNSFACFVSGVKQLISAIDLIASDRSIAKKINKSK